MTSTGSTSSTPRASAVGDEALHGLDLVGLEQRRADALAERGEEREAHAAADEEAVDRAEQVLDHAELVAHLGAAQDDDVGAVRVAEDLAEHLDLGQDEAARGVRQQPRDVGDAGLLAVHDAEAVADEQVGEPGELGGEGTAYGGVLARLAGVVAHVLQQGDVAVAEPGHHRRRGLAGHVGREGDRAPEQLGEARGDRRERQLGLGLALGAAQVGHEDDARPARAQRLDGRQRRADAAVVGDATRAVAGVLERDVEVRPHEDPATGDVEVVDRLHEQSPRGTCRRTR